MRQGQLYELPSKPDDYRKLASDGQLQLLGGRGVAAKRLASGRKRKPSGASAREHQPQFKRQTGENAQALARFTALFLSGSGPQAPGYTVTCFAGESLKALRSENGIRGI